MHQIRAIVLYAKPWSFVDENSGQVREGVTVEYLMTDSLSSVENEDGSMGYRVLKESMSINKLQKIVKVPGIYGITYGFDIQKGKPVMKLQDVEFISEVEG